MFPGHSSLSISRGSLLTLERPPLEKAFDELTQTKKEFTRTVFQKYPLGRGKQEAIAEGRISKWRFRHHEASWVSVFGTGGYFPQSLPSQPTCKSLSEYVVTQTLQIPRER